MKVEKLWGGRFATLPSQDIIDFLSGRDLRAIPPCDERLIPYDLWGNGAHVLMLYRQGIVSRQDARKILKALREIEALYLRDKFKLDPSKEDVHSNIESFLIERVGMESGGKIHTGRSRNDQIAVDMRLYLRDQALDFVGGLIHLVSRLLLKAKAHRLTIMPGYTHHQPAVVSTFGHLLLSFAEGLVRDMERFLHWFQLFNESPLGSAAGYGTSFDLDRRLTTKLLGFERPTENVTDPITQRWEPEAELAYAVAVMMNHLSTMAQTLILFSTAEFHMVRLSDRHSTGSSIMPQKRNPDPLEAIKAKTALVHGMLVSLLSIGKALFIGYNRETQWTKYWVMDLIDESKPALSVMAEVIEFLEVDKTQMLEKTRGEFIGATSLMEWMVHSNGLPLRKAKAAMEKAVKYSEEEEVGEVSFQSLNRALLEMNLRLPMTEAEVKKAQKPSEMLARFRSIGIPGFEENLTSLLARKRAARNNLILRRRRVERAKELLRRMEKQLGR